MVKQNFGRGMDLVNALLASPAEGAPLVFTGGSANTELLREPPRTAHDSLYIARVIAARAGLQPAVVKTVNRTGAGVAGDTDLTDTDAGVYGTVTADATNATSLPAAESSSSTALFALARGGTGDFFVPAGLGVEVYGLLVEIQSAGNNTNIPSIEFDVRGCGFGASSYNSTAVSQATCIYANATQSNINISGTVSPPSSQNNLIQRLRFLVLPAVQFNGNYYYTPFVCRPSQSLLPGTTAGNFAYKVIANSAQAGRAVIHCRLNASGALPTGTTVNYQLLTRGTTDVENLIRRVTQIDRATGRLANSISIMGNT